MREQIIFILIEQFANYLSVLGISIVTIILGIRIQKERKEKGYYNVIRLLILGVFIGLTWVLLWEFFSESTPLGTIIPPELVGVTSRHFSIYTFGLGFMITISLVMVFYANEWEMLYLAPVIFYIGMIGFWGFTGNDALLKPYIYSGGVVSILFLYITGIRIKDNGSLGLAAIFTLVVSTLIFQDTLVAQIMGIGYSLFSLLFAFGRFRPFKPTEVKGNE